MVQASPARSIGFHLFAIDPLLVWLACGLLGFAAAAVILGLGREAPVLRRRGDEWVSGT